MAANFMFGGCCCRTKLGYDDLVTIINPADPSSYSPGCTVAGVVPEILNIALDVSRLEECKVVYAGFRPGQSVRPAVIFDPADWPTVRSYIEGGGRLVLTAENALNLTQDTALTDSFLAAMGSTMRWGGGTYESPPPAAGCDYYNYALPGSANIVVGLPYGPYYPARPELMMSVMAAAAVTGGTSVFVSVSAGVTLMAVEQLGNGFLFFNADNAIYSGCEYSDCVFFDRLYNYADSAII